jgi:hypothetical protein
VSYSNAAVHGFAPDHAKRSGQAFALYFACPMTIVRDPKLDKAAPTDFLKLRTHLFSFLKLLLAASALQSLFTFIPGMIPPIGQGSPPEDSDWYSLRSILQPRRWFQNIWTALFYQTYISCFGTGLMFTQSLLTGFDSYPIMDNPCLTARTPSEFWGRKWNLVIHEVLKTGVYLPVRRHFSKYVAMLASFITSALFHEWILLVITCQVDDKYGCNSEEASKTADCFQPRLGGACMFFLWQAFLMSMQFSPLGKLSVWKKLPDPLATLLLLIAGGCSGHWFAEAYLSSPFFVHAETFWFLFQPAA